MSGSTDSWQGIPTERVVAVLATLESGLEQIGSGYLVGGGLVLTAEHCTRDKKTGHPALSLRVVRASDGEQAAVALAHASPPDDVAVLELLDSSWADRLPPVRFGRVDRTRSGELDDCEAIGYPLWQLDPRHLKRNTAELHGAIRRTDDAESQYLLLRDRALTTVMVPAPPTANVEDAAEPSSPWGGLSGALVFYAGVAIGVVVEHQPRQGASALRLVPFDRVAANRDAKSRAVAAALELGALRWLPAGRQRAEPAYWATVREIHWRTELLVGRQRELAEIAAFAVGTEGYRWLVGGPWAGKTSLLAEAVTTALPDEVDVVAYFLSRLEGDADSGRFLVAVIPQLAFLVDEDPRSLELQEFRALWKLAAARATAENRHLLLVVDGLDEDLRPPGLSSVGRMLPSVAGGRAHVLVAGRPYPELPSDLPPGHPLSRTPPVEVEPSAEAERLAELARQELDELIVDKAGTAVDVLGLLTAAAGPLAVEDLANMTEGGRRSALLTRQVVREVIIEQATRSLQPVGPVDARRYRFAHPTLLEEAQSNVYLSDPGFRRRIHRWAQEWREAGWPSGLDDEPGTPRYLLDTYPATLATEPERLTALVSDNGWVAAAIETVGVDRVVTDLRRASAADPTHRGVAPMLATVTRQSHHLRPRRPLGQPGYVMRQLWLQAAELSEDALADSIRTRLRSQPSAGLLPRWTTRRASRALSAELGRSAGFVHAVAALADGRVVSGGFDGRVLMWDPARPEIEPRELGHDSFVNAVAVLADGRVVSGGERVLVWDPAGPDTAPRELGRHDGPIFAVAALADGRVVSGASDGRVLVWDPAGRDTAPRELGRHDGSVGAVAALADGRVVSGASDGRVLVWDPARPETEPPELGCSVARLATGPLCDGESSLVIAHTGQGICVWSVIGAPHH